MNTRISMLGGALLLLLGLLGLSAFDAKEGWTPLLDKELSQWEVYLSYRHQDAYKGEVPTDEQGREIKPLGYGKKGNTVFTVIEEKGEPVLKVSGEIYGCVFTKQEFENYHLKLKVKWGEKKWEPRLQKLKDSGILYHSIGEAGVDYWRAWMLSQEFQIMEGHMGDYWNIANSAIDIRALIPEGVMNPVAHHKQAFLPMGSGAPSGGFCLRSADRESSNGEWTQLELICIGYKSLHIVNGQVVMVLQNSRYMQDDQPVALTRGKIQLQSEAAEVFFKDIQIRPLTAMPKQYTAYFQ